jgi:agmatine/peptidylarginine deiminase
MDIKQQELELAREKIAIARIDTQIRQEELEIKRIELDIAREKLELARAEADLKEAQIRLTDRQILGFDDNKKQTMLDTQMNAWGMMFSSGLLDQVPSIINGCFVDSLYIAMSEEVGITPYGDCQKPTTTRKKKA